VHQRGASSGAAWHTVTADLDVGIWGRARIHHRVLRGDIGKLFAKVLIPGADIKNSLNEAVGNQDFFIRVAAVLPA